MDNLALARELWAHVDAGNAQRVKERIDSAEAMCTQSTTEKVIMEPTLVRPRMEMELP